VSVALAALSENWPVALRQEIAQWNLREAIVALPAEPVREAMKTGRVVFSWQTLRSWITPKPPAAKTVDDNTKLELPIAVLSPLFLTGQKQPGKPAGMNGMDEIPDLFFDGRKVEISNGKNNREATVVPAMFAPEAAPIAAPAPAPRMVPSPVPRTAAAQAAPVPAQSVSEAGVMRIQLKNLTELWPEKVRAEVAHWNLEQLVVALPADKVNAALKLGKVVFSWKNLRSWMVPTPPPATSLRDETLLELPLPVIMPVFLAGRQKQQAKSVPKPYPVIDDDIPDPFADFLPGGPNAANAAAPSGTQKAPPALPVEKAAKEKATKEKPKTIAEPARTENAPKTNFLKREEVSHPPKPPTKLQPQVEKAPVPASRSSSTPSEILASAIGLEGVAGALVALSDGFKVASKLPPGLDGDALAAFLPHIFSKVDQSARELRMGDLNNLNFTVDNIPWKIFRVNQIFFAALGHAGQPMPTDQLAALAHKLTFKN
jgi:predicted regulator of Ras-like GTPase activity (Roadblock/LC7/MglB family)